MPSMSAASGAMAVGIARKRMRRRSMVANADPGMKLGSVLGVRSPGDAVLGRSPGPALLGRSPGPVLLGRSPGPALLGRSPGSTLLGRGRPRGGIGVRAT